MAEYITGPNILLGVIMLLVGCWIMRELLATQKAVKEHADDRNKPFLDLKQEVSDMRVVVAEQGREIAVLKEHDRRQRQDTGVVLKAVVAIMTYMVGGMTDKQKLTDALEEVQQYTISISTGRD